ncbi:MAG: chemotaxis protein CheR [Burkholderiales bacterium]|nr:chemotaxis protein CheR [Burkholderiales bacterium]
MALQDSLLSRLSDSLIAQMGLHFPRERWGDLERGIAAAAHGFGFTETQSCLRWLVAAPLTRNQIEILAGHLTVGETYFFRDKRSFEVLEEHVFPELIRARDGMGERRLRVWSAGCCTGEEPYSIAMLLDRLIPNIREWNVSILATDINPESLRKAVQGVYGEWSFRDAPAWLRERYFKRRKDRRFEIRPHIRKRVTFSYLNLADDDYPSLSNDSNAMDVILCRNVLMYFAAERAKKVVGNLRRALFDGGWLITSPTETSSTLFSAFTAVEFPGVVLYRKMADPGLRPVVVRHQGPVLDEEPEALHPCRALMVPQQPAVPEGPHSEVQSQRHDEDGAPCQRARICANQGKLDEAIAWCEKAIAADKLNPAPHYLLATIQQECGQRDAAAQSLKRALYLDPNFVLAHFALGALRLSQGQRREAERHFDNVLALLHAHSQDEILSESEGLTAGRLGEIIASMRSSLPRAAAGHARGEAA